MTGCRRFGSAARLCAVLALLAAMARAEEPGDFAEILERTSAAQREALTQPAIPELVPPLRDEDLDFARRLLGDVTASTRITAPLSADDPIAPTQRVFWFVSFSMPAPELRAILEEAASHADVRVVFQGVRPGGTIGAFARELRTLAGGIDPVPEVGIDPPLFRKYAVHAVPEILLEDGTVHRARGSIALDDFEDRVADAPQITDLGRFGPTYDILEPDLITVMQARLAALDVEELEHRAAENYWTRTAQFVELPNAGQDAERAVSTSFEVTRDISAPDGTSIARAGEVIDLARIVPLSKWYVVFDATDAAQRAFAHEWIARADAAGCGVSLITTRLDRARGWDGLTELQDELGLPVSLLREDLVDRFHLRAVPSILRRDEGRLVVQEYALD